jgi:GTP-binding protein EngB required for normal cell division
MAEGFSPAPPESSVESFRAFLERVQDICHHFQIVALNRQMEACEALLRQNQPIDIAILGQFKAGKSSFLNCLVGENILPVGAVPVTTVITRLQFGEKERARIHHFDGSIQEVPLRDIQSYVSEAHNPGNQKNVEVVDLELPSLRGFDGLRLVDTPGLGSIFKYHMETSEEWVPEVGAALLAISSDRPLAQSDLDLIRELFTHTPRVILLLTKIDLLSPGQLDEVLRFLRESLRRELDRELPIFPFSTRIQTDEWKRKIQEEFFAQISSNREREMRKILRHKLQSLGRGCLNYLEIAFKTAQQADRDREELQRLILDDKVNYDLIRQEINRLIRENTLQTRVLISKRLETHVEPFLRIQLMDRLAQALPSWRGNLWQLTRKYEEWLQETLSAELIQISKNEYRHFLGTLQKAHMGLSRSLEVFRSLLSQNVEKVLGLKLPEADWKIDVAEPSQPDIKISRTFDYNIEFLWFLIPMFLFRRFFERHYLNQIPREVEVNLSRLAAQWEDRINRAIEGMKKQALKYVQDELATIEALLSRSQGQSEAIGQAKEEIHRALERIAA